MAENRPRTDSPSEKLGLAPLAANVAGKVSSAVRDLAPLAVFGVGRELDSAILATLAGSMVGSIALSVSLPFYLPRAARGENLAGPLRRFRLTAVLVGAVLVLFRRPVLGLLDADGGLELAFALSVLAGVVLACAAGLVAELHSARTNAFALAVPAMAGPAVVGALAVAPTVGAYALGLLLGSLLDVVVLVLLVRRQRGAGLNVPAALVQGGTQPGIGWLFVSQGVVLVTVFVERGLASRMGDGVVGAMASANRIAFGLVAVLAGTLTPGLIRGAAVSVPSRLMRLVRVLNSTACLALILVGALLALAGRFDVPLLPMAFAAYLLALPVFLVLRAGQAVLQGMGRLSADLRIVIAGAVTTIAVVWVGSAWGSEPLLLCGTPLGACSGALLAGYVLSGQAN